MSTAPDESLARPDRAAPEHLLERLRGRPEAPRARASVTPLVPADPAANLPVASADGAVEATDEVTPRIGARWRRCRECNAPLAPVNVWEDLDPYMRRAWRSHGIAPDAGGHTCRSCTRNAAVERRSRVAELIEEFVDDRAAEIARERLRVVPDYAAGDERETPGEAAPQLIDVNGYDPIPHPGEWWWHGTCAEVDVRFDVEEGDGRLDALAVCRKCPVQLECLDYALRNPDVASFGVWGGMSKRQRNKVHRKARDRADGLSARG